MKVIVVSNFYDIPYEHHVLNLLFCEGLQRYHLRKKNYTEREMRKYLDKIPAVFLPHIILHSHFDLIDEYGLKGAHFTKKFSYQDYQQTLPAYAANTKENLFHHLSFSLHSVQEIKELATVFDYIFLSPIFDSISNRGYNSKFKVNDLKAFLNSNTPHPDIIALGGIKAERLPQIIETGFDGLALLGHIWTIFEQDQDIVAAVKRFQNIQQLVRLEVGVEK